MEAKRRKGIQFHTCRCCDGNWLPGESLRTLYEQSASAEDERQIFELACESRKISHLLKCPSCSDTGLSIIEIHGIELDVCGNCSGVFFDTGELESLRKKLKTNDKEHGVAEHLAGEGLTWLILTLIFGG